MRKIILATFVSGRGSQLRNIIKKIKEKKLDAEIKLVVSSKKTAPAFFIARRNKIKALYLSKKRLGKKFDSILLRLLKKERIDLVVLAGYLKKISPKIVRAYRNKIINIHPAWDIRKFGGKGMYGEHVHKKVLNSKEPFSGVTIHFVDEIYDHGPIIWRIKVPIFNEDTPDILAERILDLEHKIYPWVIQLFAEGRIKVKKRKVEILPPNK